MPVTAFVKIPQPPQWFRSLLIRVAHTPTAPKIKIGYSSIAPKGRPPVPAGQGFPRSTPSTFNFRMHCGRGDQGTTISDFGERIKAMNPNLQPHHETYSQGMFVE
eukprot:TRINITY_DN14723_c0_g1_i2.p1 TRINITY_DN14723_c0_g1~~TRINITY_DN14723_c0_g1_i2.p1  ORF type:complete len:105 (+),score=8.56 TRINITY_DN14723_c0_g1_i2:1528-1842(+)